MERFKAVYDRTTPQLNSKRFQVALSFAGEHRSFVEGVAEQLSRNLGQNQVFYDRYYEAELARPNLDTYLINIYQKDTDLIAIFLCSNYAQEEWCGLEWRMVRDVLKRRRDSEIMFFKFDDIVIEGLLSIDGYIDIGNRTPEEVAGLILQREVAGLILQRIDGKGTLPLYPSKSKLSVMTNPCYGDSLQLLGRDKEIRRIEEKLLAGNHCSIVGPPGSGRSVTCNMAKHPVVVGVSTSAGTIAALSRGDKSARSARGTCETPRWPKGE